MTTTSISKLIILAQLLVIMFAIWKSVGMIRRDRISMTALFYLLAMVSMILSDLYWITYLNIRPDIRMPFAANEISEWAVFLLLSASLEGLLQRRRPYTASEIILMALFVCANTVLWIGWSGEWIQDIITGFVFGYFLLTVTHSLYTSETLNRSEWTVLGTLAFTLVIMQVLTSVITPGAKPFADLLCCIIMIAGIAGLSLKTILSWRLDVPAERLLYLGAAGFGWCVVCMYMSAEPMYYIFELAESVTLVIMPMMIGKVVEQNDLC